MNLVKGLFTFGCSCILMGTAFSQEITSVQLPSPDSLAIYGQNKSLQTVPSKYPNQIFYGASKPSAANKTVIVFVHGRGERAEKWWITTHNLYNNMYDEVYKAGYRSAYVSLPPDKDLIDNGKILVKMLDTITQKMGVQKVVIVAHSKGGLDTDAALVLYGGYKYVRRVITISSPHQGTIVSDWICSPYIPPYAYSVFYTLGEKYDEGTYCMQRAVMQTYRQLIDNHPDNAQVDEITFGATGYTRPLVVGIGSPHYAMEGLNDGLVAYYRSKRFNSVSANSKYDPYYYLDHNEIRVGSYIWKKLKPYIPTNVMKLNLSEGSNEFFGFNDGYFTEDSLKVVTEKNIAEEEKSNYQMFSSTGRQYGFHVSKNTSKCNILLQQLTTPGQLQVLQEKNGNLVNVAFQEISMSQVDGIAQRSIELINPADGNYIIKSDNEFVGIITHEGAPHVTLTSDNTIYNLAYALGQTINFKLNLAANTIDGLSLKTATLKVKRIGNLQKPEENSILERIVNMNITSDGDLTTQLSGLNETGIYSMAIFVKYNDGSERTVVSTFAITDAPNQSGIVSNSLKASELNIYPNPSTREITVDVSKFSTASNTITVTDVLGRTLITETVSAKKHNLNIESLQKGCYTVSIHTDDGKLISSSFIKQ